MVEEYHYSTWWYDEKKICIKSNNNINSDNDLINSVLFTIVIFDITIWMDRIYSEWIALFHFIYCCFFSLLLWFTCVCVCCILYTETKKNGFSKIFNQHIISHRSSDIKKETKKARWLYNMLKSNIWSTYSASRKLFCYCC